MLYGVKNINNTWAGITGRWTMAINLITGTDKILLVPSQTYIQDGVANKTYLYSVTESILIKSVLEELEQNYTGFLRDFYSGGLLEGVKTLVSTTARTFIFGLMPIFIHKDVQYVEIKQKYISGNTLVAEGTFPNYLGESQGTIHCEKNQVKCNLEKLAKLQLITI